MHGVVVVVTKYHQFPPTLPEVKHVASTNHAIATPREVLQKYDEAQN